MNQDAGDNPLASGEAGRKESTPLPSGEAGREESSPLPVGRGARGEGPKKHRRLLITLGTTAVLMFGFCFALVPLYNAFCKVTGLQGKYDSGRVRLDEFVTIDTSRTVTVHFVSQVASDFAWDFYPSVHSVRVHPGELKRVTFNAINRSGHKTLGQAIPSIAPGLASLYFRKTECFCFNQQPLAKGEQAEMPLVFYIARDLPADIEELTLSYSLFDASSHPRAPIVLNN